MVLIAFKLESFENYKILLTRPYISFIGKIYSKLKQDSDDDMIRINVNEYNNFNFTNKERINFKMQVVYEVKLEFHFRKLILLLQVRKVIYVVDLLDLNDDDLPYVKVKVIYFLEDSTI